MGAYVLHTETNLHTYPIKYHQPVSDRYPEAHNWYQIQRTYDPVQFHYIFKQGCLLIIA